MGAGYFIIAILGCADGGSACQPVGTVPTRFESRAACSAATTSALITNSDFDYPTIVAECRPGKSLMSGGISPQRPLPASARRS